MSERRQMSDEVLESVIARLDREAPREELVARVRAGFLDGFAAEGPSAQTPDAPVSGPRRAQRPEGPDSNRANRAARANRTARGRPRLLRFVLPLLAAAAVVLAYVQFVLPPELPQLPQLNGWRVAVANPAAESFLATLVESHRALWDGSAFDVLLADGLEMRVLPGTRLAANPEALVDPIELTLETGELLIRTHPGYAGPRLAITTPQTEVRVTGTALSVMVDEKVTCVCVAHGTVRIRDADEPEGWCSVGDEHTCILEGGAHRMYAGPFYAPETMLGAAEAAHLAPLLEFAGPVRD